MFVKQIVAYKQNVWYWQTIGMLVKKKHPKSRKNEFVDTVHTWLIFLGIYPAMQQLRFYKEK